MNKKEILQQAKLAREEEIFSYQINIDNYRLAIDKSKNDLDLSDFANQLELLLKSSIIEQKKAKIMLDVISEQLGVL